MKQRTAELLQMQSMRKRAMQDLSAQVLQDLSDYSHHPVHQCRRHRHGTVTTQFITADDTDTGKLTEVKQFYTQNGHIIEHPKYSLNGNQHNAISDKMCATWVHETKDGTNFLAKGGLKAVDDAWSLPRHLQSHFRGTNSCGEEHPKCHHPLLRHQVGTYPVVGDTVINHDKSTVSEYFLFTGVKRVVRVSEAELALLIPRTSKLYLPLTKRYQQKLFPSTRLMATSTMLILTRRVQIGCMRQRTAPTSSQRVVSRQWMMLGAYRGTCKVTSGAPTHVEKNILNATIHCSGIKWGLTQWLATL